MQRIYMHIFTCMDTRGSCTPPPHASSTVVVILVLVVLVLVLVLVVIVVVVVVVVVGTFAIVKKRCRDFGMGMKS